MNTQLENVDVEYQRSASVFTTATPSAGSMYCRASLRSNAHHIKRRPLQCGITCWWCADVVIKCIAGRVDLQRLKINKHVL